jgi:molecular chaperone GrpE
VRDALKEEREHAEDTADAGVRTAASMGDAPSEEGTTDVGAGEQPAPAQAEAESEPKPEAESKAEPESDEDELAVVKRERDEYLDLAKRNKADFENFRKRASKDIAQAGSRARAGLIREMLPVLDNLERALANAPSDDPMAEGVKLVLMDLHGVLQRAGIEAIEPKGDTFDPNVHEALTTRAEEGVEAGVVLDVVEKGYRSPDQVIRPARVIVAA